MSDVPALVIAGTHSGSGKTTVTLALLAALRRRGVRVQGFKVGPDFIDPGHHASITGRPGRNLDTWMIPPGTLASLYRRGAAGAELAIVEGVMGLFDGLGPLDEAGSTADLARGWALPVVLVVDAKGMSRSAAAMARGFAEFDPGVRVAGVVANRVGGRRHHEEYLAPALQAASGVEPLGFLARDERLAIPSRHLGLLTAEELRPGSEALERLADAAEAGIDLDRLIALARPPRLPDAPDDGPPAPPTGLRVALARDAAFCFYYEDNLDLLRRAGAEVLPFSPLEDRALPEGAGLVYLGGGYPEVFAGRLAANAPMRESIRRYHDAGGAILAECGGLMACCRSIVDAGGREFPAWDLIPARVRMQERFAALGYVAITTERETCLGPPGTTLRGHEFHYSTFEPLAPLAVATATRRPGREPRPDAVQVGGLVAGYAHAHFGSNPAIAAALAGSRPPAGPVRRPGPEAPNRIPSEQESLESG
jgi:cobyrinic acid a,c-diamide synthase